LKAQTPIPAKSGERSRNAYDKALTFLLALLAFLIPLKFGVPNLDAGSPTVPLDLAGIGKHLKDFFTALFSSNPLSALSVLSNVLSWPWPEEMAQLLILLAFFLWGMKVLSSGSFLLKVGRIDAAMWLFVLWGLAATLLSPGFHSSMVILKQFVSYGLLYFLAVHALDDPDKQRTVLRCFLASTAIVAALALYQFFVGLEATRPVVKRYIPAELQADFMRRIGRRRVFSVFVYPNSLAGFLLLAFPLTLFYAGMRSDWLARRNVWKLIAYVVVLPLACFVSFLLTQSKGGYLTLLVVACASVVAARKRLGLKPKVLLVGFLAALILLSGILLSPPGRRLIVEKGRFTFAERLDYWKAGCRMFLRSPVIGNGFNSFGLLYPRYRSPGAGEARTAHNNFLQIQVETGLVGFLFFAAVWVFGLAAARPFLRDYVRGEKTDPLKTAIVLSAATGISCFLIHSLADFDLYIPGIAMTLWLFLGLMVGSASSAQGRQILLSGQRATLYTLALLGVCGFGIFYTSKTLNSGAHLAMAQSILQDTDQPPGLAEYDRAIAEVRKAMKWDATNHNLHLFLARTYSRLSRYDDALAEYAAADGLLHHLSPTIAHHTAQTILTKMEAERRVDWPTILRHFRTAVSRSPASAFHRLILAYYLAQAGQFHQSQKELQTTRQLEPSGKQALKTAAIIYGDDPIVDELKLFFAGSRGTSAPRETTGTAEKGL